MSSVHPIVGTLIDKSASPIIRKVVTNVVPTLNTQFQFSTAIFFYVFLLFSVAIASSIVTTNIKRSNRRKFFSTIMTNLGLLGLFVAAVFLGMFLRFYVVSDALQKQFMNLIQSPSQLINQF